MRRHGFGLATLCLALTTFAVPAQADQLEGQWISTGYAAGGSPFAVTLSFFRNGAYGYEMAVTPGAGMPRGTVGGIVRCEGVYRFDGENLVTEHRRCAPYSPAAIRGPVVFSGREAFNIGGNVFYRRR